MKEEWRDIEGFEGRYQISNLGNVRSLDHMVMRFPGTITTYLGRPLKVQKGHKGHLRVTLGQGQEKVTRSVAKLVAYYFLEGYKDVAVFQNVKFKDGDPTNCKVDNLYW